MNLSELKQNLEMDDDAILKDCIAYCKKYPASFYTVIHEVPAGDEARKLRIGIDGEASLSTIENIVVQLLDNVLSDFIRQAREAGENKSDVIMDCVKLLSKIGMHCAKRLADIKDVILEDGE
jgi:hypothetical protein